MQVLSLSQVFKPFAGLKPNSTSPCGCDGCVQLLISKDIERPIQRPLAGCDYSAEGNILLEDEETLISVPLRGVIADGGYRNIIVLVISNVPLRGVTARPTKGRSFKKRLIQRPLAGCDGKNEQK